MTEESAGMQILSLALLAALFIVISPVAFVYSLACSRRFWVGVALFLIGMGVDRILTHH